MGLCLLTLSSCLWVSVETESGQVEAVYTRAKEDVLALTFNSNISERPEKFKMLIYDPEEGQVVRISLPLWLVREGMWQGIGQSGSTRGRGFEFDSKAFSQAIQQLSQGLVAEIWTDREKILWWLE
jgi:hypothetical protein